MEASADDRGTRRRWTAPAGRRRPSLPEDWKEVARPPRLDLREVHVFRSPLDLDGPDYRELRTHLAPDELARAHARSDPIETRRAVTARGLLRLLLGSCLEIDPGAVPLALAGGGKPVLDGGPSPSLHFNHARSGSLGVFVITGVGAVGIDVERIEPVEDLEERTEGFSATERETLRRLPPGLRSEGFFRCWTRKEALLKASGGQDALPCSLRDFDISLTPGVPPQVYRWRRTSSPPDEWTLLHLRPESEFVGAVALRGAARGLRTWSADGIGRISG